VTRAICESDDQSSITATTSTASLLIMRLENEINKMNLSGSGKQKSFFRKFLPDSARAFQILHSRTAREQERPKDWAQKNDVSTTKNHAKAQRKNGRVARPSRRAAGSRQRQEAAPCGYECNTALSSSARAPHARAQSKNHEWHE
jgi:hypothetical protein